MYLYYIKVNKDYFGLLFPSYMTNFLDFETNFDNSNEKVKVLFNYVEMLKVQEKNFHLLYEFHRDFFSICF